MISNTAKIGDNVTIGKGVYIWDYTQIRDGVTIGENCIIGRNVYIGPGVKIGANCKIQNNALIYEPSQIADGVFIGPGVILTNDRYPRAVNLDLSLKSSLDWELVGVNVEQGASIGAGAICIAPLNIGKWALIGAGSVVTKDVEELTLVLGNPARVRKELKE